MATDYITSDGNKFGSMGEAQIHEDNINSGKNMTFTNQQQSSSAWQPLEFDTSAQVNRGMSPAEKAKQTSNELAAYNDKQFEKLFYDGNYSAVIAESQRNERYRRPYFTDIVGCSHLYLGNYDQALYWLGYYHNNQAGKTISRDAELAVAYMKKGDINKAKELCRSAVDYFLNPRYLHDISSFVNAVEFLKNNGVNLDKSLLRDFEKVIKNHEKREKSLGSKFEISPLPRPQSASSSSSPSAQELVSQGIKASKAEDFDKAFELFEKAAEMGNTDAMFCLGTMHKQGENYEEAAYWFGEAAKEGDVTSLLEFGKLYRDGLGVDQDFETAEQMLTLALENGDTEAEAELAKLKQMRGK